jgi:Rps23 Pro-64 3,4-dihydroxylase Tpa1-like proline 4-hydroxylase
MVREKIDLDKYFVFYKFYVNNDSHDLYFWGVKKGESILQKKLSDILANKELYTFNDPFPHYVIDGLFNDDILKKINNPQYLTSVKGYMSSFDNDKEKKIAISHITKNNKEVYDILTYLNSKEFTQFLSDLTGVKDLISDADFNGGGVHLIPRGGKLGIHIDFSRAIFDNSKFRRLNVLLYLNENWKEEYEGALELWNNKPADGGECIKKVYPIFNRLIIFGTSSNSWHGHPTPLNCPEGEFRKSLATYYYSNEPGDDLTEHSTVY